MKVRNDEWIVEQCSTDKQDINTTIFTFDMASKEAWLPVSNIGSVIIITEFVTLILSRVGGYRWVLDW
jgi:hypothetical protein